ncbi:MAG TPA: site-specific integrase, partial [Flavipsychrobacter sp.]
RTAELRRAEKIHFHLENGQWRIPGAWMKMDNDHIVPLSKQMLSLIKEQMSFFPDSPYLFPSSHGRAKLMSAGTINSALDALGVSEKHTGHGFRALAKSTLMEKLKYAEPVADVQLAHAPKSSNGRAYDRAKFLDDRIQMMQDWSDYLDQCRIKGLQQSIEKSKQ